MKVGEAAYLIHLTVRTDHISVYFRYHGPPKPTFLEVFMVNNLVFRWSKPLFFMVWGAHGIYYPPGFD